MLSRRVRSVPIDAVGGFCLATAVLAWACHLILETTVWPAGTGQWLAVAALGLGPVGATRYVWDHVVKHGNIRALGAFAYSAPLLSTVLLIAFAGAPLTWVVAATAALIVGGAGLAARDLLAGPGASAQSPEAT